MSTFKDAELTEKELMEVKAGIQSGHIEETLDKMGKEELSQFRSSIVKNEELSLDELDNVKAGMPIEVVEEETQKNENLFRKH